MTDQFDALPTEWLTIPDIAEMLDESVTRVRRRLDDRQIIAVRRDGVLMVPAVFFRDDEILSSLRGTIIVLADAGFDDAETVFWLLTPEDSIGAAPIDALRAGRKSEVRRVAQTLA